MLRDEQIDLRRQRAAAEQFQIQNLGRNRVFSDYQVTNPATGGQYRVTIRGFEVGDNACECPDFRTNTLGTCKHIEAVLASLHDEATAQLRHRKAAITRPQLYLQYGEQLRLGLHLPPRHSDPLRALAETYFDLRGLWKGGDAYPQLLRAIDQVPERVTINSDAMEFMEREVERHELAERERELLYDLEQHENGQAELPPALRDLLRVPLYPYQLRGAVFLACRGRAILGDDMGLGKCLGPDTPVFVNGTLIRAGDVWDRFAAVPVPDGEGEWAEPREALTVNALAVGPSPERIVSARIVRLYRQRINEPVRLIRLDDGSRLLVTRRHKLLTRDGWDNNLQVGDRVCVPARLEWSGAEEDPDLVTLLAWQIAEGDEPPSRGHVRITQNDHRRLKDLRARAARIGARYGLKMNRMPIVNLAGRAFVLNIYSRDYERFLRERGYAWGNKSAAKRIPDWIMSAGPETARLFLRHFFAAEGSVSVASRAAELSSASGWLMQQIACLLRRFGIWLRIKAKRKRATNGANVYRTYYTAALGGNGLRRFAREIGFADPVKQAKLRTVCDFTANTNVEGVPASDLLSGLAKASGLPLRQLGVGTQYFYNTQQLSVATVGCVVGALDRILSGEAEAEYRRTARTRWTDRTLAAYQSLDRASLADARDRLARMAHREVFYSRVVDVQEIHHDGWVYDFEVEGHHNYVAGGLLCHNTIQTMAAVELLARERGIERVLVVAPASVKYQWESEIRKFTGRDVQVIEGTAGARRAQYARPAFYRLINYEIVVKDLDDLNAWQPDLIVLDEAQRIKNWESKTSRAVKRLRSRYAAVLTGTPLENKLEELYSIVTFVDDRRLGPAFQFLHDHRVLDEQGRLLGYRNLDKIREKLEPILLRRTRAEVLSQLPARTDNVVYVEMADAQRGPYAAEQTALVRLLVKKYLNEADRKNILCHLANLRMLCDSTYLLDRQTNVSPKLEELAELLRDLLGSGPHKVVIFSQWEQMVRLAADVVERLGVAYTVLHGGVPGKERRGLLERFRDDPDCRVFLSTDAGGTGLNLQSADTVINLEVPWNPAVLEQRIARVHRMGQHRPVQVFNLVTRHGIEERVLRTLDRKRELFAGVFTGESDEVVFAHLGHSAFLQTVRELIEEPAAPAPPVPAAPALPATDGQEALVRSGVEFLEALANVLGEASGDAPGTLQLRLPPPDVLRRGTAALRTILHRLEQITEPSDDEPCR